MTKEEADFVERNADAIVKVKKMSSDYRKFLLEFLRDRLIASGGGQDFTTRDEGWAVRCSSDMWGRSNLAFSSPSTGAAGKRFQVAVYLVGLDDPQQVEARMAFQGMRHWREGGWLAWQSQTGFDSREDATVELCRLAGLVSNLFPALPEPGHLK